MRRLISVKRLDLLLARPVRERIPPSFEPCDDSFAVTGDLAAGQISPVLRRNIGELRPILYTIDRNFQERLADAKDVMRKKPNRAVTRLDRTLREPFSRNLTHIARRGTED